MNLKEAKELVLREYPSAYYDPQMHEIRIFTEGIILGAGLENAAWKDAAKNIKDRQ